MSRLSIAPLIAATQDGIESLSEGSQLDKLDTTVRDKVVKKTEILRQDLSKVLESVCSIVNNPKTDGTFAKVSKYADWVYIVD